jgi:hypothetical protein
MKKTILGGALFLFVSFNYVSAVAQTQQISQDRTPRNIVSTQLPATLLTSLKTDYKDYWITECYENGKTKRPDYFVTLENANQTVHLRASDKSSWEVVSTVVKD